jgi:hypothetical protein
MTSCCADAVAPWLPTVFVIILTAVALTMAGAPLSTPAARRSWWASILLVGSFALAGSVWQGEKAAEETVRHSASATNDDAGDAAKPRPAQPKETLEKRNKGPETEGRGRTVSADAGVKFAEYLRGFGSHRVVVSCAPDDLEVYDYANRLVNILRAANWDAEGPEVTEIFGDLRAVGINLYVNADNHSDTVKILLDAFAKFNIPFRSRVTPSQAIPDTETVELFVAAMPSPADRAGSD